jgi:hypothetical protein
MYRFIQHILASTFSPFSEYTITLQDESAHYVIQEALEEELLVKIEDVYVKQRYLVCLLDKDKWLDDEVRSPY